MTDKKEVSNNVSKLLERTGFINTDMTTAQFWYIRSEIQQLFTQKLAYRIADEIYNRLYHANWEFVSKIIYDIDGKIKPEYPLIQHDLDVYMDEYSDQLVKLHISQEKAIRHPLENYLTYTAANALTNKIHNVFAQWNKDLIEQIKSEVAKHYGLPDADAKDKLRQNRKQFFL